MIIYSFSNSLIKQVLMRWFIVLSFILFHHHVIAQNTLVQDSVWIPASTQYSHPSAFGRFIIGENYRKEWATPVAMPVFYLKKSGLKIEKLGGGMQTKSLQLKDGQGREWALRTVDKDAKGALPPKTQKNKLAVKVVQDLISASYPYSALIVPALAAALDVPTANPRLFYVPGQNDLGKYDTVFAGKVCMLELKDPVPASTETISTEDLLKKMQRSFSSQVDQESVLKARLLDMVIADWDRHDNQYKWYEKKESGRNIYSILPKDRDQAFFKTNGWLEKIATLFIMKWIKGFNDNLNNVLNLNYKAQLFDAKFLNELDRTQWQQMIQQVQNKITDSIIYAAVHQVPAEIYAIRGNVIAQKIIGRRNDLMRGAMKYYNHLSYVVKIDGSDEDERFEIKNDAGNVKVQVFKKGQPLPFYERSFVPKETKIIELHGWKGNDEFVVQKNVYAKIKFKFFGGEGEDTYLLEGDSRKQVFDSGDSQIIKAEHTKFKSSTIY